MMIVTSKYEHWLGQRQKARLLNNTSIDNYKSAWPRKTRMNDFNLEKVGVKPPKFMKWEKKLLDQLLSKSKNKSGYSFQKKSQGIRF
jgi:predicted metal-binding transcription factor (methanogenesis marker protein 9)